MTVSIEKLDKVKAELTITVPVEKFEEAMKRAYKDMAPKIKVPGFRPGKVPMAVVEKMYGAEVFFEDAANYMIMPNYIDALKEAMAADSSFQAISRPDFEIVQMEKGKEFIYKAVVDTKQTVELGEYKGIAIEDIDPEVTDKEIDQYIDMIRSKQAEVKTIIDKRNVLKKGDTANIDFVGKKDGVPFAGGSAEGYDLEIGSGSFIPGFEEQMEGMKVEEVRDIELSFPEDYYVSDLAGQPVVFEVTLHAIKRKIMPELNDEFVKDVSNFETVAEYKEDIKNMLSAEKTAEIKNRHKAAVAQKVTEQTDVVAPESMVKEEAESFLQDIRFQMSQQGIKLEDYLNLTNGKLEDVENECRMRAETLVKQTLVFEAIAEKEGLEVTDEDLDAEYARMAEMYNQPVDSVKEIFAMRGQVMAIKRNLLLEKVSEFLLENAKIG
ncbi:MAG: trigger factor [Peptococcaceae bacterium]|nr:trigger factor [Peptococcaceae bacterium]